MMAALNELIPPALGADIAVGLAAVAAFISVVVSWHALRIQDPVQRRARSIALREQELRSAISAPVRREQFQSGTLMARVVAKLRLMQGKQTAQIRNHLAQAGVRSREALITYLFCKLTLPLAFGATAVVFLEFLKAYPNLGTLTRLMIELGAVLFGFYGPEIWVRNAITKRRKALIRGLPDALDLLVICVEAGLSLDAALKRTATELERGSAELSDEFHLTSVELGFLPERGQALTNLAARTGIKPISAVVSALLQTERFGTPLAQSLRVLASEFRAERMLKAEEKAARLPATLTVPMVMFILPCLFIVLIGPAVLRVLDNFVNR